MGRWRRLMRRRRRSLAAVGRGRGPGLDLPVDVREPVCGEERVGLGRAHAFHARRRPAAGPGSGCPGVLRRDWPRPRHRPWRSRRSPGRGPAPSPSTWRTGRAGVGSGSAGGISVAGTCASSAASRLERSRRRRRGPSGSPSVVGGVRCRAFDLYNTAAARIHAAAARPIANPTAAGLYDRREGGVMAISERAGRPADPSILVDVDRLVAAYYEAPDPSDPAQRVAFGTSGHRGSSLNGAFNEAHIAATTEAICRYRAAQGTDGPLFIGRDTARAVGAGLRDGPARSRRARRGRPGRRRRRLHADAGHLARDPRPQPRTARPPGRRHRRHAVAQPARGRRLQVQPAERRPGRHGRHAAGSRTRRTGCSRPVWRASSRSPSRTRARPSRRTTSSPPTSTTSARSSTWTPSAPPGSASAPTRSVARASPTGRGSASATAST